MPDQVSVSIRLLGLPWSEPTMFRLENMRVDPSTGERYGRCEIDGVQVRIAVPPELREEEPA